MVISCDVDNETSKSALNQCNANGKKHTATFSSAMVCKVCGLADPPLLVFALDSLQPGPNNKVDYLHIKCGKTGCAWEIVSWGNAHKRWGITIDSSLLNKALEKSRFAINPINFSKVFLVKDVEKNLLGLGLSVANLPEMRQLESMANTNFVSSGFCKNETTQQIINTSSHDISKEIKQNTVVLDKDTKKGFKSVAKEVPESKSKHEDLAIITSYQNQTEDEANEKVSNEKNIITADKTKTSMGMNNNNIINNNSSQLLRNNDSCSPTYPQHHSFLNLENNQDKYFAVKVPDNIKPGDKIVVSLPGHDKSFVGFEYPAKLQNANFKKVANGGILLLVNPNIVTIATVTATPDAITSSSVMRTPTTSSKERRTSVRNSAERLRVGHNSYPLQVCNRTNSRIGKMYQVQKLPIAQKTNVFKTDASYEKVWDPKEANTAQNKGEDIESVLKSMKYSKDLAMTALHQANYNIASVEEKLLRIILKQPCRIPYCYEMLERFHFSMVKSKKNIKSVSERLNASPQACLLFYYERYKQTHEYALFKMYRRAEKDECEVCSEPGKLLCCDGCNRPYHLKCANPPLLEVPEGDWFCEICTSQGKVKRSLDVYFNGTYTRTNSRKRSRR